MVSILPCFFFPRFWKNSIYVNRNGEKICKSEAELAFLRLYVESQLFIATNGIRPSGSRIWRMPIGYDHKPVCFRQKNAHLFVFYGGTRMNYDQWKV